MQTKPPTRMMAKFFRLVGPTDAFLVLLCCCLSASFSPTGRLPLKPLNSSRPNANGSLVQQPRGTRSSQQLRYRTRDFHQQKRNKRWKSSKSAELVEQELSRALESLKAWSSTDTGRTGVRTVVHLFPTVRECNSALASLGDQREFLRALRLFGKMRKAASLPIGNDRQVQIPVPTLVTFSTLMSRFVKANKPLVALRLWKIMKDSNIQGAVDVKACNILMNCYAKLADVSTAQTLLNDMESQLQVRGGPFPLPNLITYNTFLAACQNAGDIDTALEVAPRISKPDTRTYTTMIATVGRKASKTIGQFDPTPAFEFLDEMIGSDIYANGKTFSALIDACGRCRRSDLALQGLRIMVRYKKERGIASLPDEVGAWTALISACGRNGRLDTAIQLFYAMPKFGVDPNTITCGALVDSLLRAGRTAETLLVLKFMKKNGLPVTEVMYTSLLLRAEKLAHVEQGKIHRIRQAKWYQQQEEQYDDDSIENENARAIEIYTGLIESLSEKDADSNSKSMLLMKAFLLFQEVANTEISIDLPCYHALLRVCAQARDVNRALDVYQKMIERDLIPTDATWKLLLWSAVDDCVAAESIWKRGISQEGDHRWTPSVKSLRALLASFQEAQNSERIASIYHDLMHRCDDDDDGDMGLDRLVRSEVESSRTTMHIFLEACKVHHSEDADAIATLPSFQSS